MSLLCEQCKSQPGQIYAAFPARLCQNCAESHASQSAHIGESKLSKAEVIKLIAERYGDDITEGLRIKIDDHSDNPLAPERFCYKISYKSKWLGRQRFAWWPNTVGKQTWN